MSENLLIEAKRLSSSRLIDILKPHILTGFNVMYDKSTKLNSQEPVKMFQIALTQIKMLPENVIKSDYKFLVKEGKCDEKELSGLIQSVYMCQAKLGLFAK